jgi:hypothetical protein
MANPYLKFNGKTVRVGSGGGRLISPFEPIPPYTLRVEFVDTPACQSAGFDPTQGTGVESAPDWAYGTWRHVYGNVYDWTYQSDTWFVQYKNRNGNSYGSPWGLTNGGTDGYTHSDRFDTIAYRVVGANLTGVKYVPKLFSFTTKYLVSVALFDTSMIECAGGMFFPLGATKRPQYLTSLPDFDFSGINNDSIPLGQTPSWAKNNNILGLMAFSNGNTKLIATPNLTFPSNRAITVEKMYYNCSALTSATLNGLHCSTAYQAFIGCQNLTSATLSNCVIEDARQMFGSINSGAPCLLSDSLTMTNVKVVGSASAMFAKCNLTTVPLFDTSETTSMTNMFAYNHNVESGALALYQQASSQATPPSSYSNCFAGCGRDTVTGAAELAQIPTDWGGTYTPPE